MPALAIRRIPKFEPELVPTKMKTKIRTPGYTIGAHADFRRDDFIFPRMQSRTMRETPWDTRTKPIRSWSALLGTGSVFFGLMGFVLVLSTVLI